MKTANADFAIAVHGGAGTIRRDAATAARMPFYHEGLYRALAAGHGILASGGSALDAVTRATAVLEDDPLFNAGRGSVFTAAGTHEMDAALMDGSDLRVGAVAAISGPRNPILAARAVLECSDHVLLVGEGAIAFCRDHGIAFAEPRYFHTEARRRALHDELERRRRGLPDDADAERRHGTVGTVARDIYGNLAAATSTGGMTGKLPGRVGDSPLIGAGTYLCAQLRLRRFGDGSRRVLHPVRGSLRDRRTHAHAGLPLAAAAREVLRELGEHGGEGGVIAVGPGGEPVLPFNTAGMYRGYVAADGTIRTAIWDEPYREW